MLLLLTLVVSCLAGYPTPFGIVDSEPVEYPSGTIIDAKEHYAGPGLSAFNPPGGWVTDSIARGQVSTQFLGKWTVR
jgi:hypothetical protein